MTEKKRDSLLARIGNSPEFKREIIIYGATFVAIVVAAVCFLCLNENPEPPPRQFAAPSNDRTVAPSKNEPEPAPLGSTRQETGNIKQIVVPAHSQSAPAGFEAIRAANEPAPAAGPSPEAELHYQKTRLFMAEAKESLPVIGIRAFNAVNAEARQRAEKAEKSPSSVRYFQGQTESGANGENAAGPASEEPLPKNDPTAGDAGASDPAADNQSPEPKEDGNTDDTLGKDDRGLQDGEVWIRIDPSKSAEYKEIMAQTADLYRTNTGFQDDVTVLLWVGGQVMARTTYGQ